MDMDSAHYIVSNFERLLFFIWQTDLTSSVFIMLQKCSHKLL